MSSWSEDSVSQETPFPPFTRFQMNGHSLRHSWLDNSPQEGMERGFWRGWSRTCLPSQLPGHALFWKVDWSPSGPAWPLR